MTGKHDLHYPIGEFSVPDSCSVAELENWIEDIREFPVKLKELILPLSSIELNWNYRPGGWNIKQVIHHCADSHLNAWCRFKLALTEEKPTIRPYFEAKWAELPEANLDDISDSLILLEALHRKWVRMLEYMNTSDYKRTYLHPEHGSEFRLDQVLANYAWHCKHHLAHIKQAIEAKGSYI